ncbi:hypothetical protein C3L33_19939, partial [Rhododendron williamsianum]
MSIPPNSPWRGCASSYSQPVSADDDLDAQNWIGSLDDYNPQLSIVYRNSSGEQDIRHHVFRWDDTPYQEAFENGFRSRRQDDTPNEVYASLDDFVHQGGRPLDSRRAATHVFVSTTLSSSWHPPVDPGTERIVYRYEIYAPGGIWVAATLGDRYQYRGQDEVCFVEGIAPQYIRTAQAFRLITPAGSRFTTRERVDNVLRVNGNFNPQSHPSRMIMISRPINYYVHAGRRNLILSIYRPQVPDDDEGMMPRNVSLRRELRQVSATESNDATMESDDPIKWYCESYINAAFRSSYEDEVYLFRKDEYVLVNYAPGSTNDKINYAPKTTDDKIIKGPMAITDMFPFFKGTVFESSVDASFEATEEKEAYLFKGNQYALINYHDPHLIAIRLITEGFACLKDTIFESGIEAAFASHHTDEAYLFKGDSYALINFAPGTTDYYIIGGLKKILPNWPSLSGILWFSGDVADCKSYINAAFRSSYEDEVYLFMNDEYVLVNYAPGSTDDKVLNGPLRICEGYPSLRNTAFAEYGIDSAFGSHYGMKRSSSMKSLLCLFESTIFESGIEAAFASHHTDEAYLFKGDSYALINFAPGTTDYYIIGGPKKILPNWPSLSGILPRKNRGFDVHDHTKPDPDRDHDELYNNYLPKM